MSEHKAIREALEAGPSEWKADHYGTLRDQNDETVRLNGVSLPCGHVPANDISHKNTAYLLACNPSAIRALLADLDDARAALQAQPAQPAAVSDEEILTEAARHLGGTHVENCGLGDIKAFARAILALRPAQQYESDLLGVVASLGAALRRLTFAARTTGGTSGPDAELMGACAQAEQALSIGGIAAAMRPAQQAVPMTDDTELLEFMFQHRAVVSLELEGGWDAELLDGSGATVKAACGLTPRDALRRLKAHHGITAQGAQEVV